MQELRTDLLTGSWAGRIRQTLSDLNMPKLLFFYPCFLNNLFLLLFVDVLQVFQRRRSSSFILQP